MAPDVAGDVREQEDRRACEGDPHQQADRAEEPSPAPAPTRHQRELGNPEHQTCPGGDVGGPEEPGLVPS